jgi:hypothetical protein
MLAEQENFGSLARINREGDCLGAKRRPGNLHSADDWEQLHLPEIERQQKLGVECAEERRSRRLPTRKLHRGGSMDGGGSGLNRTCESNM